ncbi:MAG TPA: hypothetical protein VE954_15215 [Oligoflexus sp.]|uniref:SRPBCC family protein n=1 Tax=Oligoflexus sp. TaxID=1971216 RepID=UPI002D2C1801|nr:hypothetical protein [Oligoflexus sp.]HYX34453.1 hypothetical protein [Oligoflexus sp.]
MPFLHRNDSPASISCTLTVLASADALYEFCQDPTHLAQSVAAAIDINIQDPSHLHWKIPAKDHGKILLEGDAELVEDVPAKVLTWRGDSALLEARLEFTPAPGDFGTEVRLSVHLDPGVHAAAKVAKTFSAAPEIAVSKVLRHIKSLVESGEMPTLAHNPDARKRRHTSEEARL